MLSKPTALPTAKLHSSTEQFITGASFIPCLRESCSNFVWLGPAIVNQQNAGQQRSTTPPLLNPTLYSFQTIFKPKTLKQGQHKKRERRNRLTRTAAAALSPTHADSAHSLTASAQRERERENLNFNHLLLQIT